MRADLIVAAVAFLARLIALLWAGGRFPPTADGFYYHTIASRIAAGLGSTWLWPDGKVTYAAHYPVGYPALLALVYRLAGPSVVAAGVFNALLGTAGAVAAHRLAAGATRPRLALVAGLAVALHPALVMYTPAIMTEGVTASLVVLAAWLASLGSIRATVALGLTLGIATLVRPQSLLLAPCLGLLAVGTRDALAPALGASARGSIGASASDRRRDARAGGTDARYRDVAMWTVRARRAALVTSLAVAVCLPWTFRNCVRMKQCALVSFNGGWNLLIGAHAGATGTFAPLEAPEACRTVWDEAEKDACFGREARAMVAREPARWLALVPAKLAATFDYSGAPGFYLHQSNGEVFDDGAKRLLGIVETAYERFAYLGALIAAALAPGAFRRARWGVAGLSVALLFQTHAYLSVLGLAVTLALARKRLLAGPTLWGATFAALVTTMVAHAVFFGSGRYSMVVFPLVTALALSIRRGEGAEQDAPNARVPSAVGEGVR